MTAARVWPAPAKLNLFLRVVGRRADGYHLLETLFQFLDYGDELTFSVTDDGQVVRSTPVPGIPPDMDLTVRAARLLQASTGCRLGARIGLRKRIPTGGGLGGGSSDAATALIALNELWGTGLDRPALAALGLRLGADVPVFVHGHAAFAEGVGEVLTPADPPEPWYLVIVPPVQVATARVYADYARERRLTPPTMARTIRGLPTGQGNDLEAIVRRRYPDVERAFEWLAAHGEPRMTGSGGCVYAEVSDAAAGERLLGELPSGFDGFVARGMNRHPLAK
ncbi:MAG TPA: 4-(cytidine 5'-diphospho)-2-C-methyl-D-erythritol kinase [Burkholderiales bacterium]